MGPPARRAPASSAVTSIFRLVAAPATRDGWRPSTCISPPTPPPARSRLRGCRWPSDPGRLIRRLALAQDDQREPTGIGWARPPLHPPPPTPGRQPPPF